VAPLVTLANDTALRTEMGRRARQHIEEHYSLERLPAYLDALYTRAVPRPHLWKLGAAEGLRA
jgi:hypothetical protein